MEFKKSDILTIDCMSIKEFCTKYGQGVSAQAVSYKMRKGDIDWVKIGTEKLIVMTDKTKLYVPNASPTRSKT